MSASAALPTGAFQHVKVRDISPPQLGQHTDEVLTRHLGLAAEALQTYRNNGVLG